MGRVMAHVLREIRRKGGVWWEGAGWVPVQKAQARRAIEGLVRMGKLREASGAEAGVPEVDRVWVATKRKR